MHRSFVKLLFSLTTSAGFLLSQFDNVHFKILVIVVPRSRYFVARVSSLQIVSLQATVVPLVITKTTISGTLIDGANRLVLVLYAHNEGCLSMDPPSENSVISFFSLARPSGGSLYPEKTATTRKLPDSPLTFLPDHSRQCGPL